jgi:hypothetical protein
MAKEKKGFILYCDIIHTIEKLSDEQAGKLFKHILKYVNDQEPIAEDIITEIAFEPIKQTLKRDLQKYEDIRVKNQENARKRWNATASERMQVDTKNAVIDKDIVKVKDKVIESIEERKIKFYDAITEYVEEYPKQMLRDFFNYWSEHGEKDKKLRFEKEKTFGIKQRLSTWHSRNPKQYETEGIAPEELKAIKLGFLKPKQ